MTKVNENGQLEWTFEELDIKGAWVELDEEYSKISAEMDIWTKVRKQAEADGVLEVADYAWSKYDELSPRFWLLSQVWDYLWNLMNEQVFNYKEARHRG